MKDVRFWHPLPVQVADDNSDNRVMIRQALEQMGHLVVETSDGTQLIDLALGILPDLIIITVPLSGVDVWSVLGTIKATPEIAATPIILLGDLSIQQRADQSGYTLVTKPVNTEAVTSSVKRLFDPAPIQRN